MLVDRRVLSAISLLDILHAVRVADTDEDYADASLTDSSQLVNQVMGELDDALIGQLGSRSLRDLVGHPDAAV